MIVKDRIAYNNVVVRFSFYQLKTQKAQYCCTTSMLIAYEETKHAANLQVANEREGAIENHYCQEKVSNPCTMCPEWPKWE